MKVTGYSIHFGIFIPFPIKNGLKYIHATIPKKTIATNPSVIFIYLGLIFKYRHSLLNLIISIGLAIYPRACHFFPEAASSQ